MDKNKKKNTFVKQKISLYFDENFPKEIIKEIRQSKSWKKDCRIYSAFELGNSKKDDKYHFQYCKKNKFTLVTLDDDFMNDKKYPFGKMSGIIRVVSKKNDLNTIRYCLTVIIDFLSGVPYPTTIIGDSKFQISSEGCIMRGRHPYTGEIKTVPLKYGDTIAKIAREFGYMD